MQKNISIHIKIDLLLLSLLWLRLLFGVQSCNFPFWCSVGFKLEFVNKAHIQLPFIGNLLLIRWNRLWTLRKFNSFEGLIDRILNRFACSWRSWFPFTFLFMEKLWCYHLMFLFFIHSRFGKSCWSNLSIFLITITLRTWNHKLCESIILNISFLVII